MRFFIKQYWWVIGLVLVAVALTVWLPATINRNYSLANARAESMLKQQAQVLPKSESEKQMLQVLEELDRNQRSGNWNVSIEDGRLLRILAESVGAKHVVELGTSNGYSGIWLAIALKTTGGKLTTYEIDSKRAALARENFQRARVSDLVTLILGNAHVEIAKLSKPVDFAFIDADKEGYLDYLNKLLPLVQPGGLIAAHNMHSPSPDPQFVHAITTNSNLETVFLNMHEQGMSVSLKKR